VDVNTKEQNTVEIIVGLVLPAEGRTGAELDVVATGVVRPGSHVSHFLGRARNGIVFAVGKTQVY
jgi:hypothetical protein